VGAIDGTHVPTNVPVELKESFEVEKREHYKMF
jgi:hypothetical protein